MRSHSLARFCAIPLAVGTVVGGSALVAPAYATQQPSPITARTTCTHVHSLFYDQTLVPSITGQNYLYCTPGGYRDYLTMTISKYESGTWVQVASGPGHASYNCNGTTMNMYEDNSGDVITAPCV